MKALDGKTKAAILVIKSDLTEGAMSDTLRLLGFVQPECIYTSVGLVWLGEETVIKSHLLVRPDKPKPKFRVPEKRIGIIGGEPWVVQPRCTPISEDQLQFAIDIGYFDKGMVGYFDISVNNVGLYGGRLRMFDW